MTGIVPSEEFNEQIKRTVRETIRRQRTNVGPAGRWHKKGGSGGGGFIRFVPTGEPCPGIGFACDCTESIVTMVLCTGSGVQVGDLINVWDQDDHFKMPPELLTTTSFWAHFMKYQPVSGAAFGNPGPCSWVCTGQACGESGV